MARIRHYETMFIVKATLTDEETQAEIATVKANIEKNGGTIVSVDDMGSRNLAYEIEKQKRGYYYVIYFTAPSESITELERNYRVNENIIRFIFIKSESKTEIKHWTAMSEEAAKRSEKATAK
ncbi:30S ribosomal protein S6 [Arcobacter sp. 15-2]|uniref:30S ribosomal protein S6 n=1 Tax=Arcobacter sp. 15-2 TaxID=3374109 RepID=UPI00399C872F